MTISSVELTQEGTSLSGEGKDALRIFRNYSAHYRVITDDPTTSPVVIEDYFRTHGNLPWYGRTWKWSSSTAGNDRDTDSVCKKIEVSHQAKSSGVFTVVCDFEPIDGDKSPTEKPNNDDGELDDDPLNWREQVTVSYTQITIPVMRGVFKGFTSGAWGDFPVPGTNLLPLERSCPPMASNLVPYDPAPEMEIDIEVIRFVKNIPSYNAETYRPWQSTVNTDAIKLTKPHLRFTSSIPPLLGRIKQISAASDFQNGVTFFRREIEIWINPLGWRGRLPDIGDCTQLKPTDDGFVSPGDLINKPNQDEKKLIVDADGYPATAPRLLDGFGRLLRNGAHPVWTNWQYYVEKPWAGIHPHF